MDFRSLMPMQRRDLSGNDPFSSMRREFDRLFDDMTRSYGSAPLARTNGMINPSVDLKETDKAVEVTAELPGVAQDDISLQLDNDMLVIKAERKKEETKKDENVHLMECSWGSYARHIPLPCKIEQKNVKASFKDGILKVELPKSKEVEAQRKTIKINS